MEKLQKIKECWNCSWSSGIASASPLVRVAMEDINELIQLVEQYKLQETLLLGRLQKMTLEYKELKKSSRTIRYFEMAEENLKLAQELALLKGEMSG